MERTKVFRDMMHIRQTDDTLTRVFGAGFSTAIPLLLGYFTGNMKIGTLGALGAFAFLSFTPLPLDKLAQRISKVGIGIMAGFYIGLLATLIPWLIPVAVGMVSLCGFLVTRILRIPNPGAFFVIMVTAMGTGMEMEFSEMLPAVLGVGIGVVTSVIMAVLAGYINIRFLNWPVNTEVVPYRKRLQDAVEYDAELLLSSLHHAAIIFFAAYVGQSLGFVNPYWITISTAAVLQGRRLELIFHRNVQRIIGGMIGLLVGLLLFALNLGTLETIIVIISLNICVEYAMVRNYGIANFFTNPLSLLLASLSSVRFPNELFGARFAGLIIGSLIGLAGASLITLGIKVYERELVLAKKQEEESLS